MTSAQKGAVEFSQYEGPTVSIRQPIIKEVTPPDGNLYCSEGPIEISRWELRGIPTLISQLT